MPGGTGRLNNQSDHKNKVRSRASEQTRIPRAPTHISLRQTQQEVKQTETIEGLMRQIHNTVVNRSQ